MKVYSLLSFSVFAAAWPGLTSGWKIRRLNDDLECVYGYFVSGIDEEEDWCMTATDGGDFSALGFQRCNESATVEQMFCKRLGGIQSAWNDGGSCLVAGYGDTVKEGTKMRLTSCEFIVADVNSVTFWGGWNYEQIRVQGQDQEFCLTNTGNTPNATDAIIAKTCRDAGRFYWTFLPVLDFSTQTIAPEETLPPTETSAPSQTSPPTQASSSTLTSPPTQTSPPTHLDYYEFNNDASDGDVGCLTVKDGNASAGNSLILGECDQPGQAWREDEIGLFHTMLDDDMCMQAGHGEIPPVKGSKARLYPCDEDSDYQMWHYDGVRIRHKVWTDLCVDFRGTTSTVGVDPIILNECEGANWSTDTAP